MDTLTTHQTALGNAETAAPAADHGQRPPVGPSAAAARPDGSRGVSFADPRGVSPAGAYDAPFAGPADPPAPPPCIQAGCPHRSFRAGRRSFGPNIPESAQGEYFPGDEPGARCELSGDICDPHPAYCPLWQPSDIACPACLAFTRRRWPRSVFRQSRLLIRVEGASRPLRPSGPAFYCPSCDEEYADLPAVALAALNRLRDALDDLNFAEGSLEELREAAASLRAEADSLPSSIALPRLDIGPPQTGMHS